MKDEKPVISKDNMYMLLRESKIKEFNELRARGQNCDLSGKYLRGMDVAGVDFQTVILSRQTSEGLT